MKTQLMRHFAAAIGFSVCTVSGFAGSAHAQGYNQDGTYQAPPQWSNFQAPRRIAAPPAPNQYGAPMRSVAMQTGVEELPAPAGQLDTASRHAAQHATQPMAAPRMPQATHSTQSAPVAQHHYQPQPVQQPQPVHQSQPIHQSQPVYHAEPVYQSHAQPVYPSHPVPAPAISHAPVSIVAPTPTSNCQSCQSGGYSSPYESAMTSSWDDGSYACAPAISTGPANISPWFGGFNMLFWSFHETGDNALVVRDAGDYLVRTTDLDPGNQVGFDVHFGRYLGCGRYGLDVGFMNWDPDAVSSEWFATGADLRLALPALQNVERPPGTQTAANVYLEYDAATRIRATRDIRVQGIEANLTSFGIMGARRLGSRSPASFFGGFRGMLAGYNSCGQSACGCGGPCDGGCSSGGCGGGGACRPARFFGGAAGPLARACSGRVRIQTLHGFRYFQFQDDLQIVGDTDGVPGYSGADLYYDLETENNLYGYQFGSRLTYCLGGRALFNIGGKLGVYANDAEFHQRIGSAIDVAYTTAEGAGAGNINTRQHDTSLATLMEFDLGVGYRLSCRCTVRGGYRVLGASGIATSTGQTTTEYARASSAGQVRADDSLLLHGAYVGLDYNW